MKNNFKTGFTLIELLVVITLIAILMVVIVASVTSAKRRGEDSAAKSDLSTIRTQANIYYTNAGGGTYGILVDNDCGLGMYSSDTTISDALVHATASSTTIACNVGPTDQTFAVAVELKTGTGYYCVDSTNTGKNNTGAVGLIGGDNTYALNTVTGLCS
jgi:type IV pilus assembly protein PilA